MAQNVKLDADMAYIETDDSGKKHLVIVIPMPTVGNGWIPDKSDAVERVTAIDAINGVKGFRDFLEAGSQMPIGNLDDDSAKLTVKLTVEPAVAVTQLGQEVTVPERNVKGTKGTARKGYSLDDLKGMAVDKARTSTPVKVAGRKR